MNNIRIWWDTSVDAYRLVCPYNEKLVEALKQIIPISDRAWDKASKTWTITERYMEAVRGLLEKTFGCKAQVVTKQQAQAAQVPKSVAGSPLDAVILEFFKLLPYEAAQKAYRHAAMMLHPDRGGDMAKMSAFNAAWTRLENDFFKKGGA